MAASSSWGEIDEVLGAALRALPEPVMIYDDDRVLFANAAAQRLLGASSADDLEGASVQSFLVPELADVSPQRRKYVMQDHVQLTTSRSRCAHLTVESLFSTSTYGRSQSMAPPSQW